MCFRESEEQGRVLGKFQGQGLCMKRNSCHFSSSQVNKNGWKHPFLLFSLSVKICAIFSKLKSSIQLLFVIFFLFLFSPICVYYTIVKLARSRLSDLLNNEVQMDWWPSWGAPERSSCISPHPFTFSTWKLASFLLSKPGLSGLGK